jgi:hypothetical protein
MVNKAVQPSHTHHYEHTTHSTKSWGWMPHVLIRSPNPRPRPAYLIYLWHIAWCVGSHCETVRILWTSSFSFSCGSPRTAVETTYVVARSIGVRLCTAYSSVISTLWSWLCLVGECMSSKNCCGDLVDTKCMQSTSGLTLEVCKSTAATVLVP